MQESSTEEEVCSNCGGSGILVEGGVAFKCSCISTFEKELRYKEARLPAKLRQHLFADFNCTYYPTTERPADVRAKSYREMAEKALTAARKFVSRNSRTAFGKGLLFCGNVGSGKTFLCGIIANELIEQGQKALFLVVPDLLDEIRATYDREAEQTELELLAAARNVPVLILDDLGVHNYTDWTKNKIYSILNSRLNDDLPVVVNSNLGLEQMEQHLGERTSSRMVEMCDIYPLEVPKDIRLFKNLERHL